jgi:predicted NBD/HSP70 family sugar kinase
MVKQQDPGGNADGAGVPLYLGIDIGTSGARYAVINKQEVIH